MHPIAPASSAPLFPTALCLALFLGSCAKEKEEGPTIPIQATVETVGNYEVVNSSSLKLSGTVTFGGSGTFTSHGHVWSDKNANPTLSDSHNDLGDISANGTFTGEAKGLDYGKVYYFRAYAKQGSQVVYGNVLKCSPAWRPMADFGGGPRRDGFFLSFGSKVYGGLGSTSFFEPPRTIDIWEFDPGTGAWNYKSSYPGGPREEAFGFVLNGKIYIGGGVNSDKSGNPVWNTDLYTYDPAANAWTQIAYKGDFPNSTTFTSGNGAFALDNKGYVMIRNTLFQFDPVTNEWMKKGDLPKAYHEFYSVCSLNGKGYMLVGFGGEADTWEYDPVQNKWTAKAKFPPGLRLESMAFALGSKIYMGAGAKNTDFSNIQDDLWEFDPVSNTWKQVTVLPYARQGAFAVSVEGRAFVGTGVNLSNQTISDWWEFIPKK